MERASTRQYTHFKTSLDDIRAERSNRTTSFDTGMGNGYRNRTQNMEHPNAFEQFEYQDFDNEESDIDGRQRSHIENKLRNNNVIINQMRICNNNLTNMRNYNNTMKNLNSVFKSSRIIKRYKPMDKNDMAYNSYASYANETQKLRTINHISELRDEVDTLNLRKRNPNFVTFEEFEGENKRKIRRNNGNNIESMCNYRDT